MNLEQVRRHFDGDAETYESHILRFIPYYREQNEMLMELIPFERTEPLRALDLGAGPGVLAELLLRGFPKSRVVVFDLAEKMILAAQEKLQRFEGRVSYQLGNIVSDDFGDGYDLVLSGLSIHHLDNDAKRDLDRRIFAALEPGGLFLNRDIVCGSTEQLTRMYESMWRMYVRASGEDDAAMMERYRAEDIPACVEDQLEWLREAGFVDVGCHWQRLNFAIFGGRKSGQDRL
jgi:tRNA (cmo5U34)-methyltransferase